MEKYGDDEQQRLGAANLAGPQGGERRERAAPGLRERKPSEVTPAGPASRAKWAAAAGGRLRCRASSPYFSVRPAPAVHSVGPRPSERPEG